VTATGVSCVIPVYNGARYIAEAIQSVLDQTTPPAEIVVVDDGSSDGAEREVSRLAAAVVYVSQAHAGVAAARNHGVQRTSGSFLCFLDADDRLHRERLQLQLEAFARQPQLELCDAHSAYFWSEELTAEDRQHDPRFPNPFWKETRPGHIGTWLVRRAVFDRVGPFDPTLRFSEDTDWLLRFRDGGGLGATLPQVLSYRRLHRDNATAGSRREQVRALAQTLKRSRDRRRGAAYGG
jgi:glycosyltransferase involved in cell wall biosynthesis